jgi:hypothetical protein
MENLLKKVRNAKDIKAIASRATDDLRDFGRLIECMENSDRRIASMAAWAMSHAVQSSPALLQDIRFHQSLAAIAGKTSDGGLKRNIVRAWQFAPLPESMVYEIAGIAIRFLGTPEEDIAVKAFSMTVLQNCLKYMPELKEEVVFLAEKEMEHGTPALMVRGRKLLKIASGL